MKEQLIKFLKENIKTTSQIDFEKLLEKPKNTSHGDFSFPVFILSKELKKPPQIIAKELENSFQEKLPRTISKAIATGPYINFYLDKKKEAEEILEKIQNNSMFEIKNNNPKKIMIEYPSPNTNKNLHLGHTRNMLLGNSLCNILEKNQNKIIRTTINNDKGIAICKAMLSYKLFGENKIPKDLNLKSDEFVAHWYVVFGQKNKEQPELKLEEKAQEMLVKWEKGDKETYKIWEKLLKWVFEGYEKTYKNYKLKKFDKEYFESQIYKEGKDIVLNALKNKIPGFKQETDGAVYYDFENQTYGKKYLLRGDGTTLYMTQDLHLAKIREEEFSPDKIIHIVGEEQNYHFEVLFQLLNILKLCKKENSFHLSYGYVYDKNGKKFSSRKGNIIGADFLLEETINKAKENLKTKELTKNLDEKEIQKRAEIIGFAALAFSFLKVNPKSAINFDFEKSLSFEGETGPYILYTYARIKSILRKANKNTNQNKKINYRLYNEKEQEIIKILGEYQQIIIDAANKYKISNIANYLLKLSQKFNEYYQTTNILKIQNNEELTAKLFLIDCIAKTIKETLSLYDIETLEEM